MTPARRARIVCTLGPSARDDQVIERMVRAGMDVARVNMSHGSHEEHAQAIATVRTVAERLGLPVAVLADLQGPKIRTGPLAAGPVALREGAAVTITTRPVAATAEVVGTDYRDLPRDLHPRDRLLLADGEIELRVTAVSDDAIVCRVVTGGVLRAHQGISAPGVRLSATSLTPKDLDDLRFAVEQGADLVAVSFVQSADDVLAARRALDASRSHAWLVAKLERPGALEHLDAILEAADAVMIARGDMGVELPPEQVPIWQKRIIEAASARLRPVITATQMLESMVEHPRPTRAEASDVANSVWDGTDAVMLSEETAIGRYPVEAVAMMDRIVRAAESDPLHQHAPAEGERLNDPSLALSLGARVVVEALDGVAAIVALTRSGYTARLVSKKRPAVPVLAVTQDPAVYRQCALLWGTWSCLCGEIRDIASVVQVAEQETVKRGMAGRDDTLVVLGHYPFNTPGRTNLLTVHRVGIADTGKHGSSDS